MIIGSLILSASIGATPVTTVTEFFPDMLVTQTMVWDVDDKVILYSNNGDHDPLVWALNHTGDEYGRNIALSEGHHPAIQFDRTAAVWQNRVRQISSSKNHRVWIKGAGDSTIIDPVSNQWGTTIGVRGVGAGHTFNWITWEDLLIQASGDAAVLIGTSGDLMNGGVYEGWTFMCVTIDGGYNWYTGSGRNSKWGILTWAVKNFTFTQGWVHDIKREHAFYFHNNLGTVRLTRNHIERCGRTFCQFVSRKFEFGVGPLPANPGAIHIKRNLIEDVTLGDGCEGGQAITIVGRQRGVIWVQRNTITFGQDTELVQALADTGACVTEPDGSRPIGNGAIVTWSTGGEDYESSYALVMTNNLIMYAEGAGRVQSVSLNNLDFAFVGGNVIFNGRHSTAMRLGAGNASHQTPYAYIVRNNLLFDGDLILQSYTVDCVQNNTLVGGDIWLGGGPWNGGVVVEQPFCHGAGCNYCN